MASVVPNKPRISVRDATEADLERILDIYYAAFDPDIMGKLLAPNGPTVSARTKFGAFFLPDAEGPAPKPGPDGRMPRKGQIIVKVAELLDPEGSESGAPEIVAVARWLWNKEPREEWEWNVEKLSTAEELGEGVDVEVANEFFGTLKRKERKHARGDPNIVLNLLATDPSRARLGAGSALVRSGLELADENGVPVYLEASPSGYPVYRRLGFEDLEVADFNIRERWNVEYDGSNWGANSALELAGPLPEGTYRQVIMRRPARS